MPLLVDENIGSAIRLRREARGWSGHEFSTLLRSSGLNHFHPTTVSRTESGERALRVNEITVVSSVLECDIDELVSMTSVQAKELTFLEACMRAEYYVRMAKELGESNGR